MGTVMLKPGYDASDMMLVNNPPDLTPYPLNNALVYLLEYQIENVAGRCSCLLYLQVEVSFVKLCILTY